MRRHGETDGAGESAGKSRGRAPQPGDSPPFSPGLEAGQELRSLGSPGAAGRARAAGVGYSPGSRESLGRREPEARARRRQLSQLRGEGRTHSSRSPPRAHLRRSPQPAAPGEIRGRGLQVPLSSGRQQQEPGGGCCSAWRGAGDALGRSVGRGARTRRERACACVCVRAPDCVRPLSRVTGTNSLGFSPRCARPARRSLATAPLKKPMVKVLLSKCS